MSTQHTPAEALESLVRDLNATNWSSWQSTAKFSDALRDAELVIQRERVRDAAPDLLEVLQQIKQRLDTCHLHVLGGHEVFDSFYVEMIDTAIAKATGAA
jgi:hypothetical protein